MPYCCMRSSRVFRRQSWKTIPTSRLMGSGIAGHKAEMQWRISYVLTTLLLPLLAVALNRLAFSERALYLCLHRHHDLFSLQQSFGDLQVADQAG